MLAKMATTVDAISGGRLILGLGAGWNRREYDAFGFAYDHRVSRFEEAFTIIRTLLREGSIDFHGDYYDADRLHPAPSSPSEAGPPLMVGSIGDRACSTSRSPTSTRGTCGGASTATRSTGSRREKERIDPLIVAAGRRVDDVEATAAVLRASSTEAPAARWATTTTTTPSAR